MKARFEAATVPAIVAAVLTSIYVATLAPGVTLWDSGEFLAAVHSLGIPHPPGTPLYVIIAAVWAKLSAPLLGYARAVNVLSAIATAVGCAVLAACVARWTTSRLMGIAAGLAAGGMLSVWRSATETEVYALSFALAFIALWLADRAGLSGRARDTVLALYVLALAVPLHLSALVIAPGVVLFAATGADGAVNVRRAVTLSGAVLLPMALGTTHPVLALASVFAMTVSSLTIARRPAPLRPRDSAAIVAVVILATSALAVLYFRAHFDPFVNQGNPASIDGVIGVVGREQYDVPPLWPRRAPLWLQLANLIQYSDWQVAFGLDRWVGASIQRTPLTVAFVVLAITGAAWHRARDRRSFRAFGLAFASASIGSVIVLNLRAGPSIGIGVLPADALHEARERDYFFAIAFAMAAAWAGVGAARLGVWLTQRMRTRAAAPVTAMAIACAPFVLNWRAVDRSADGPVTLAHRIGTALLESAPPNAVLLVAGDNDTYPLWYLQRVHGLRPDVTAVTIPLLPATWYRLELERRHGLIAGPAGPSWRGLEPTVASVAERARAQGRPLALAFSVSAGQREALGGSWVARGMTYVSRDSTAHVPTAIPVRYEHDTLAVVLGASAHILVDTLSMLRLAPVPVKRELDPTEAYVTTLLNCPSQILSAARGGRGSVDPRCNLR